jgi:hypothetical protein
MLHGVVLVRTDVSKESIIPIIRGTRIGHLGTTLAVLAAKASCEGILVTANIVPSSPILITLLIEAILSTKRRFLQEPHVKINTRNKQTNKKNKLRGP